MQTTCVHVSQNSCQKQHPYTDHIRYHSSDIFSHAVSPLISVTPYTLPQRVLGQRILFIFTKHFLIILNIQKETFQNAQLVWIHHSSNRLPPVLYISMLISQNFQAIQATSNLVHEESIRCKYATHSLNN